MPSGRLHPQFTAESGSIVWDTRDRCTAGHVDHDGARVNEERLEVDDKFDSVNVVDLGEHGMGNDEVQSQRLDQRGPASGGGDRRLQDSRRSVEATRAYSVVLACGQLAGEQVDSLMLLEQGGRREEDTIRKWRHMILSNDKYT